MINKAKKSEISTPFENLGTTMLTLFREKGVYTIARFIVGIIVFTYLYRGIGFEIQQDSGVGIPFLQAAPVFSELPGKTEMDVPARLTELAKSDHIALLQWAIERYESSVKDYTATFYKQERINGKLSQTEKIAIVFKEEPFSVMMSWEENAGAIDKLLYVEGQNENKMLVHPTGLLSWIKSVKRDPRSREVQKASRSSCDQFGFYRSMQNLLKIYKQAEKCGDLLIAYQGRTRVDGRECVAMERILPAKADYPYARLVLEFDVEYLLPTAISCYDWQGRLVSRYWYEDVKFNQGLKLAMFSPKSQGL